MSVSYLGLTREAGETGVAQVGWQDWYRYFPWEDRRAGVPALLDETIAPRLAAWCEAGADQASRAPPARGHHARRAARPGTRTWCCSATSCCSRRAWCPRARRGAVGGEALPGEPMRHDHRRILATGIARLRAKIKPARRVRADAGPVHPAAIAAGRGGAGGARAAQAEFPAADRAAGSGRGDRRHGLGHRRQAGLLFRFRRDVLLERAIAGSKLPLSRGRARLDKDYAHACISGTRSGVPF